MFSFNWSFQYQMKSVQSQQSIFIHVSVNLQLLLKTLQRNLNSQQQKNKKTTKKNKTKQSYGFITFTLQCDAAQPLRNTVNHSFLWSQPAQNLQCHLGALPKGMSIHRGDCVCVSVWIVMFEAMLPTETIKSTATASGRNKEPFFSHYSATFGLSKSQKTRTADKGNLAGCGTWRENELRKSWFSLPDKPAAYLDQKTKSI